MYRIVVKAAFLPRNEYGERKEISARIMHVRTYIVVVRMQRYQLLRKIEKESEKEGRGLIHSSIPEKVKMGTRV